MLVSFPMTFLCDRRLLATGWAKYDTKYAEPATKMIELQYDKVLEDSAIAKITDCPDTVTTTDGENFWKKTVTGTSKPEDAIKTAMAKWWNSFEIRGFGDDRKNTNAVKSAAHIAYDKATKIGCAVDAGEACLKKGLLYILCKYDPYVSFPLEKYHL
ncbi:SCP-like protein [Necator americanus]|uniref:SCP-like protein n=1 Tax=Necator americanus TaxID=51031 RepID=W2TQ25_NECAM|nr:SCP-like protein [Necator americanus]ETN83127.1 SCP-like protein [Necator americanus]